MTHQAPTPAKATSGILPVATAMFAIGIFIADAITTQEIAVAVLYVVVVLMTARFCQVRGVLIVSVGCVVLAALGFFLTPPSGPESTGIINTVISILSIGLTSFLVLRNQSAGVSLRVRANLLDLTHDTVFTRGMDDVITYWNRGAVELYGWTAEEVVGKATAHQLLRTVFPAPLDEINAELLRTGRWEGELIHSKADGTQVVVASRWSLQRDERQRPRTVLETNNDITERKRAEEALRQTQADLAHVSRVTTVGELTASLAHEVNQPIAAAVTDANTCLRWLARDHLDWEEAREAASRIVKDATRAAEIISRIRLLFKKGNPQRELVNLNEVIREMISLLQGEATRYSISVRTELTLDLPQVMGDRVQLQQVLMNLMINGIDAMKDVHETCELAVKSQRAENEQLMVSVSDTGVGLPSHRADQIFNAFFTTKRHGSGLGLSISRSIVESHGGRLWAADNSPRGASFCFTLPTKAEAHE